MKSAINTQKFPLIKTIFLQFDPNQFFFFIHFISHSPTENNIFKFQLLSIVRFIIDGEIKLLNCKFEYLLIYFKINTDKSFCKKNMQE